MEIREVEKMWQWDVIRNVIIGFDPENETYDVEFYDKDEKCLGSLEVARGGKRRFKTLDAAARTLSDVGINQFQVIL